MAASIGFHFRQHWQDLKRGRPGHRFQDRYERAHTGRKGAGVLQRIILVGVALVCLAIGVVLTVAPGPAVVFFFLAGGLLATESRVIARAMDWAEVRVRKIAAWAVRRWRRLSGPARIMIIVLAVCCSVATMYASYHFLRR